VAPIEVTQRREAVDAEIVDQIFGFARWEVCLPAGVVGFGVVNRERPDVKILEWRTVPSHPRQSKSSSEAAGIDVLIPIA
jgi:hypothetical protein